MEVTNFVEDILSDEYEEGEIFDEDTLYDDVSSLEEFSETDDSCKRGIIIKKGKKHRRKEHKCKVESVCRKERSGKHCYARIRRHDMDHSAANPPEKRQIIPIQNINHPRKELYEKENRFGKNKNNCTPRKSFSRETGKGKNDRAPFRGGSGQPRKRNTPSLSPHKTTVRDQTCSANSSLLSRLVGSGSLSFKKVINCIPSNKDSTEEVPSEKQEASPTRETSDCHDNEELSLRLEALKTAMIKKHEGRIKNGKIFKKPPPKQLLDDSFTDFVLSSLDETVRTPVEREDRLAAQPPAPIQETNNTEGRYNDGPRVDSQSVNETFPNTKTPLKCLNEINCNKTSSVLRKRHRGRPGLRLKNRKNDVKRKRPLKCENNNSKKFGEVKTKKDEADDIDEDFLRQLALKSLKPRSEVESILEPQLSPLSSAPAANANHLPTKPSSTVDDDIDEDILRAKLLSSMTAKIQPLYMAGPVPLLKKMLPSKPPPKNMKKEASKYSLKVTPKTPIVKKLIINVTNDSDTSEEDTSIVPDISASIDLLLQEERKRSEELTQPLLVETNVASNQEALDLKTLPHDNKLPFPATELTGAKVPNPANLSSLTSPKIQEQSLQCYENSSIVVEEVTAGEPLSTTNKSLSTWQRDELQRLETRKRAAQVIHQAILNRKQQKSSNLVGIQYCDPACCDVVSCSTSTETVNSSEKTVTDQPKVATSSKKSSEGSNSSEIKPEAEVDKTLKRTDGVTKPPTIDSKPPSLPPRKSDTIIKEIGDLKELVETLETDISAINKTNKAIAMLKKQLSLACNNLAKKKSNLFRKMKLLRSRENIIAQQIKRDFDISSQSSRDAELIHLRFKEVRLRSDLAFMTARSEIPNLNKPVKTSTSVGQIPAPKSNSKLIPVVPAKRSIKAGLMSGKSPVKLKRVPSDKAMEISAAQQPPKKIFKVSETESLDPLTPLCPYDISGVCKDDECKFQHTYENLGRFTPSPKKICKRSVSETIPRDGPNEENHNSSFVVVGKL